MAPGHFLWVQTLLIHLLCMFLNLYATGQTHLRMPVYSNKLLKILAWCLCYYKLFKPLTSCYISFISDFLLPVIYLTQGKVLFVHKRSFPNMMTTNVLTWHNPWSVVKYIPSKYKMQCKFFLSLHGRVVVCCEQIFCHNIFITVWEEDISLKIAMCPLWMIRI